MVSATTPARSTTAAGTVDKVHSIGGRLGSSGRPSEARAGGSALQVATDRRLILFHVAGQVDAVISEITEVDEERVGDLALEVEAPLLRIR